MNARLSRGPQLQVSAKPTSGPPTSGRMRQSKSAGSAHGVDYEARGRAAKSFKDLSRWAFGGGGEDEGEWLLNHDGSKARNPPSA